MTAVHRIRSGVTFAVAATWLASGLFAGNVLVVDDSGGGSFTNIQAAVDAAAIGDTILVKGGTYAGFTIDNKGVSVVAESGDVVRILGRISVLNLAPARDVILAGLNVRGLASGPAALEVQSSTGSIRVEDCNLTGLSCGPGYCGSGHGIYVVSSPDLSFARCTLRAGDGGYANPGASLDTSRAALYDCTLEGGSSGDGIGGAFCEPPDGGNGAYFMGPSFLFASGSVFQGGDGGIGESAGTLGCTCGPGGGEGGYGVVVWSPATASLLDIAAFGGQGGAGDPSCQWCCAQSGWQCCPGSPGFPSYAPGAVTLPGTSRHLELPNPQRESASVPIEVRGEPGDDVFLYFSRGTSFRYVAGFRGVQLTQQPGPPLHLGIVPPSGTLTVPYLVPTLGPGVQSRMYYYQAAHRSSQGEWTLGSPVSLVVLDQAF